MKITDVKLSLLKEGSTKAVGSITLDGMFVVSGLTLREGKGGLFVAMPSRKGADGKYYDVAFPLDKDLRDDISHAFKAAYEAELSTERTADGRKILGTIKIVPDNPLKNAEMSMEDDYDMIDGIINNGPKEHASTKDRLLAEAKEQCSAQETREKNNHEREAYFR